MADFPVTPTDRRQSRREPVSTRAVERNDAGKPWVRDTGTVQYFNFDNLHPFVTTVQKDAILAHWAAHKTVAFNYLSPFDGVVYSVIYGGRPEEHPITPTRWHVRVLLHSVA